MPAELLGRCRRRAHPDCRGPFRSLAAGRDVLQFAAPKARRDSCVRMRGQHVAAKGASHEICEHRDDRQYHCPLRFWGFSCVIERQPALAPPTGADYTIRVPRAGADRLDAFRSVLVGASKNVTGTGSHRSGRHRRRRAHGRADHAGRSRIGTNGKARSNPTRRRC